MTSYVYAFLQSLHLNLSGLCITETSIQKQASDSTEELPKLIISVKVRGIRLIAKRFFLLNFNVFLLHLFLFSFLPFYSDDGDDNDDDDDDDIDKACVHLQ